MLPGRARSPNTVAYGPIQFQAPLGQVRNRRAVAIYGIYLLALAVWCVFIAADKNLYLGALGAFIYLELGLARLRMSRIVGGVVDRPELAARVAPLVHELCRRAGCPFPTVCMRNDAVRCAAVRRRGGQVTLILAEPFIDKVNDGQLRAVIAHEVIHIVRNDLRRIWVRAIVAMVIGLAAAVTVEADLGTAGFPVTVAFFTATFVLASAALSPLNRRLEIRADLEGAQLAGDPLALAGGLDAAHNLSEQTRFRLFGTPPWSWLLSPVSWRLPTHPPMPDRIARLNQLDHRCHFFG